MSNFLITPNMQLANPVPGVDPGPDYANNISNDFNIIDRHNHSPGNGVLISPNGMNINSDLPFGVNNAILLRSARFAPQVTPLALGTDLGCLYVSGVDLYYNDVNGNQIQVTASGAVNATSSGIVSGSASAAFSGGVLVVKSSSTSGANVLLQSVELTNSGNLTNILTLQAPTLSGSSSLTLPVVPGAASFMQLDASGNMSASVAVSGGIATANIANGAVTTAKIADGAVTKPKLVALGEQLSSSITFSTASGTLTNVTGLAVTITTTGRPLMMGLINTGVLAGTSLSMAGSAGTFYQVEIAFSSGPQTTYYLQHMPSGTTISPSIFSSFTNQFPAGTYTIQVQASVAAGGTLSFNNVVLYVYEID